MKNNLSIKLISLFLLFSSIALLYGQTQKTPEAVIGLTDETDSLDTKESIEKLETALKGSLSQEERLEMTAFLASLQEHMGQYADAQKNYSIASNLYASINSKKSNGPVADFNLLISAVRCALSCGDTSSADFILSTGFTSCTDNSILSYVKLYAAWSWLCKAENRAEVSQPAMVLQSLLYDPSALSVKPKVLLTLWYITGEEKYGKALQKEFPSSPECAIAEGKASIMPAPFWYFVPAARPDSLEKKESPKTVTATKQAETPAEKPVQHEEEESGTPVKQQLGFFRDMENAEDLVKRVKAKGFNAEIIKEEKASGNVYYAVVVPENKEKNMGQQLKNAGFECYPVF